METGKDVSMNLKVLGAMLIILACGGFGFFLAYSYRKEIIMLRQVDMTLGYLISELQYRQLPLPELCRKASEQTNGSVGKFFMLLAQELEAQVLPDVNQCVDAAMNKIPTVPITVKELMDLIGNHLGNFDLCGQIQGLEWVRSECKRMLSIRAADHEMKRRNYQTLGLCAGAALAILFI